MRRELVIVRSDRDRDEAAALIAGLAAAAESSSEAAATLRAQALLIEDWERARHPRTTVGAADAIRFHIEQAAIPPAEIAAVFGARSRASEVLAGKRGLSLAMIRRIHAAWGIPLAVLVGDLAEPRRAGERALRRDLRHAAARRRRPGVKQRPPARPRA
jgi:HTH-type transcriptional regulator / antitoxin HigA